MERAKVEPQQSARKRKKKKWPMLQVSLVSWMTVRKADSIDEPDNDVGDEDEDGRFFGGGLNTEQQVRVPSWWSFHELMSLANLEHL
jgi:hypothetical protein